MYDMKIVPSDGSENASASNENVNCIKLLVELKDVDSVDSHLESAGVDSVVRPDEDIAEYKLWDDEHLCVTYTVYASDSATAQLQSSAASFEDRR